ncbi:MAG: tetratricopeptide repeat protein [Myxococcales bacterium]|nr:tetratricopeptide repeat protein [Myxococcales bacterium]
MSSRLEEILSIVAQFPADPFARYGLAMEYRNLGRLDEARRTFAALLADYPDYVPQYLMYGNLLVAMKDREQARWVYEQGIAAAARARNHHAERELRAALAALEELDED